MYSLKLGTGTMIVITDRRLVKELVDKKSSIYNGRPESYVGNGIITGGDHLLAMDYGELWRAFRKVIYQHFKETMVEKEHTKVVNAEAIQMCRDFLLAPNKQMLHPKRFSNSITMSLRKFRLQQGSSISSDIRDSIWSPHTHPRHAAHDQAVRYDGGLVKGYGNRKHSPGGHLSLPTLDPRAILGHVGFTCESRW
jgi:hypothetical protein